jgi:hypothetical protein
MKELIDGSEATPAGEVLGSFCILVDDEESLAI